MTIEYFKKLKINRDANYMNMAKEAANNSTCVRRHLGTLLVTSWGGTKIKGWNGPPDNFEACKECPRYPETGIKTLYKCRAIHAERRCLLIAARLGVSTLGSTLYAFMGVPCKDCLIELIEAGIEEIVCVKDDLYNGDNLSGELLLEWIRNGGIFRIINPDGIELPDKFNLQIFREYKKSILNMDFLEYDTKK